jgi:hypothetical protein
MRALRKALLPAARDVEPPPPLRQPDFVTPGDELKRDQHRDDLEHMRRGAGRQRKRGQTEQQDEHQGEALRAEAFDQATEGAFAVLAQPALEVAADRRRSGPRVHHARSRPRELGAGRGLSHGVESGPVGSHLRVEQYVEPLSQAWCPDDCESDIVELGLVQSAHVGPDEGHPDDQYPGHHGCCAGERPAVHRTVVAADSDRAGGRRLRWWSAHARRNVLEAGTRRIGAVAGRLRETRSAAAEIGHADFPPPIGRPADAPVRTTRDDRTVLEPSPDQ